MPGAHQPMLPVPTASEEFPKHEPLVLGAAMLPGFFAVWISSDHRLSTPEMFVRQVNPSCQYATSDAPTALKEAVFVAKSSLVISYNCPSKSRANNICPCLVFHALPQVLVLLPGNGSGRPSAAKKVAPFAPPTNTGLPVMLTTEISLFADPQYSPNKSSHHLHR